MNWLLTQGISAAERGMPWPPSTIGRCWVIFGFAAQAFFAGRFLLQWIASERERRSHVPVGFWYLSLAGGLMLFAYAVCWRRDPVFAVGQSTGCVVYVRNLMLLRAERKSASLPPTG